MSSDFQRNDAKPHEEHCERAPGQDEMVPLGKDAPIEGAVFGQITEDGPNYRGVRLPHSTSSLVPVAL